PIGLRLAFRRHQPGPQFADHLLAGRRVIRGLRDVEAFEIELALEVVLIVTTGAEFLDGVVGRKTRRGVGQRCRRRREAERRPRATSGPHRPPPRPTRRPVSSRPPPSLRRIYNPRGPRVEGQFW